MKKEWSSSWKSSSQVRKQRKYRVNAPLHQRAKFLNARLSKELSKKIGRRSLRLRKGDKVKVVRGGYSGKTGTIDRADIKTARVYLTGLEVIKRDGSKVAPALQPSNLIITEIKTDDKRREKQFTRITKKSRQ